MSLNLRDELNKLSNTAPVLKDVDDYSDDETRAKVGEKSKEYEDELNFETGSRRFRAAIGDLSEYGMKYKGKKTSRKEIQGSDYESDEKDEEEEDVEGDEDEEEDNETDEEEEDTDEIEDEDNELDQKPKKSKKQEPLRLTNFNQNEEIAKGKAVKNQLNFWDNLVEVRVRLQNILNSVNQFPQFDQFEKILQNVSDDFKTSNDSLIKENQESIEKVMNQLIELQQRIIQRDPESNYIINDLKLNVQKLDESKSKTDSKNFKRKRIGSEGSSEESDEQDEENDNDEEDEEIYSDTDEEMRAEEIKKAKKQKKITNFHFNPLKPEQFEDYLSKFNKSFQKYRDSTIQKWYDKTRLTTGKSFESLEKPILQQIEHILLDKDRIIKRTQLKRGQYKIVGKEDQAQDEENMDALKDRHLKDYDAEIFDDQDFYNQLLRELIERKSNNISDPVELSRKSIELQKLRVKNKKKVDTKASKGRKIKFDIHKPLVNFMAPINRVCMSEDARNELFRSLFGGNQHSVKINSKKEELDFSSLFKGF